MRGIVLNVKNFGEDRNWHVNVYLGPVVEEAALCKKIKLTLPKGSHYFIIEWYELCESCKHYFNFTIVVPTIS